MQLQVRLDGQLQTIFVCIVRLAFILKRMKTTIFVAIRLISIAVTFTEFTGYCIQVSVSNTSLSTDSQTNELETCAKALMTFLIRFTM